MIGFAFKRIAHPIHSHTLRSASTYLIIINQSILVLDLLFRIGKSVTRESEIIQTD